MANWTDFRPGRLLDRLVDGGVDFVVVGGIAIVLQAQPRFTKDLDICYAAEPENLERLGSVLVGLHARLRGVPDEPPFIPDAGTLRQVQILTLTTDEGELDLLVDPAGAPSYAELRRDAVLVDVGSTTIRVASIEHLLSMKRAAGRPLDLADVEALEIARRRTGRRRRRR